MKPQDLRRIEADVIGPLGPHRPEEPIEIDGPSRVEVSLTSENGWRVERDIDGTLRRVWRE